VVLVDERTIRPDDAGGPVRALLGLVKDRGDRDWRDQVVYLSRA